MTFKEKWKRFSATMIALTALTTQSSMLSCETATAADVVSISPYAVSQVNNGKFEGWGTSLCWWANRVGYSDSLAQQSAELFFGDEGLRMNIARFNIGGGDDPSHTHITRTDSNMPGYTVWQNGQATYDWSKDANQRNVLMRAIDACSEELLVEMFSNSPPYYMCQSGCSTGNQNPGKNNLKDDCYDDFAVYMAEVCKHYKEEWGVKINSVEPLNEPYTNFWGAYSPKQEGCHFDIGNSESTIILEIQKAMAERGMADVIICGTDETSIDTQIDAYNALSDEAKNAVTRIDTHTYGGSKRTQLYETAVSAGKNLWMSEVDGAGVSGTNPDEMGAALWLAQRMVDDCNGLRCSAWILWQAIDNHISAVGMNGNKDKGMVDTQGGFWGLAVADHDNDNIILTKKYYAFGQLSRYIRPGSMLLPSSGSSLAAYDPDNDQLVICMLNTAGSDKQVSFDLSQFSSIGSTVQPIRTSNSENWMQLPEIATSGSGFSATMPANSITTYILNDVTAEGLPENEIPLTADMVTGSNPWHNSANDCKKVVDGNLSTFFDGVGNGWVQIDLGTEYQLDAIAYAPRSGHEPRCVDAVISASKDGEHWDTLHTIQSLPAGGLNYITALPKDTTYRYVRYAVPEGAPQNQWNKDNVYCCNLAEIKLYGEIAPIVELVGDVNLDGHIDIADAVLLQAYLLTQKELSIAQADQADLTQDHRLDARDLSMLKKLLMFL